MAGYPACGFGVKALAYGIFGGPLLCTETAALDAARRSPCASNLPLPIKREIRACAGPRRVCASEG